MVEQAHQHLAALPEPLLNTALERVQRAKGNMKKPAAWSMERFAELNVQIQELRVAVLGEEKASELSVEDGKRSPVELY
jgi:beta-N-acetylhexosaminidase